MTEEDKINQATFQRYDNLINKLVVIQLVLSMILILWLVFSLFRFGKEEMIKVGFPLEPPYLIGLPISGVIGVFLLCKLIINTKTKSLDVRKILSVDLLGIFIPVIFPIFLRLIGFWG